MKRLYGILLAMLTLSCQNGKQEFDASGTLEATEVIVSAEASGKLMAFTPTEGLAVKAGETLGYIDTMQLHYTKMQWVAKLTTVDSRRQDVAKQIAVTRQQITTQQQELIRARRLVAAHAANQKQIDDIEAQIALLEKQLEAQLSTLEKGNQGVGGESTALWNQIAQIEDQLQKSRINSPITGTVLVKYAEQGELTATGKPLFKVADIEQMELRCYITSGQLTELKLGQEVGVYADYQEKERRRYRGTVVWIADKAEFTPKTIQTRDERANLVYAVKVAVKNDGLLKIGMYADVKFVEE